jgi:hypothetical protein
MKADGAKRVSIGRQLQRVAWHVVVAPSAALGLSHVATLGVSNFEGGRGYAALGLAAVILVAYLPALFIGLRILGRIGFPWRMGIFALSVLPWALWIYPMVSEIMRENRNHARASRAEAQRLAEIKSANDADWKFGVWRGGLPRCMSLSENAWYNNCAKPVDLRHCWNIAADDGNKYEAVNHLCSQGDWQWVRVEPGQKGAARPWCRSYTGGCVAQARIECSVAVSANQPMTSQCP